MEHCFTSVPLSILNVSCRGWNETRCPNGVIHPDYSDPNRILKTQFQDTLLNLDSAQFSNIPLFKCPVESQYFETNTEEDASFLVFKSDEISSRIRPKTVLYSSQAGTIIHKVNYTLKFDEFTFSYASLASLTDLIKYADFRNHPMQLVNATASQWTEDVPLKDLFSFLLNYTAEFNLTAQNNSTILFLL